MSSGKVCYFVFRVLFLEKRLIFFRCCGTMIISVGTLMFARSGTSPNRLAISPPNCLAACRLREYMGKPPISPEWQKKGSGSKGAPESITAPSDDKT